jgi:hypothetical protein
LESNGKEAINEISDCVVVESAYPWNIIYLVNVILDVKPNLAILRA